jgi:hypothetical protein
MELPDYRCPAVRVFWLIEPELLSQPNSSERDATPLPQEPTPNPQPTHLATLHNLSAQRKT